MSVLTHEEKHPVEPTFSRLNINSSATSAQPHSTFRLVHSSQNGEKVRKVIVRKVPNDLKAIVVAYNVPKGEQPVRVVNTFGVSSSVQDPRRVKKFPMHKGRQWKCPECEKQLSSKRSYNEHMNIHTQRRPFKCEYCEYAAASQMTLRRHILRNHTSPQDWGYKCPYCKQNYMEPASYQQHIQSRHNGKSCTYGCPFVKCTFSTKCFSHFRVHFMKHGFNDQYNGPPDRPPQTMRDEELIRYLIDDECGEGYRSTQLTTKRKLKTKPMKTVIYTNDLINRGPPVLERSGTFSEPFFEDYMKQPLEIKPHYIREELKGKSDLPRITSDTLVMPPDDDWIENEVEVLKFISAFKATKISTVEPLVTRDGRSMDDFELD